jgi:hypothetical protein
VLAVRVTVCDVPTAETVATNPAVVDPAGTVTEAGTVTAPLLLARFTVNPPVAAVAFNVTVQLSVPAPVKDPLVQLRPLSTGTPVPLRPTIVDVPLVELLVSVSCPVKTPAAVGSNCTVNVALCMEFRVSGKLRPEMLKPVPATVAALTVTDELPVDVRVSVCVAGVFTFTLPNVRLDELTLRPIAAALSCTPAICVTPDAFALSVATCATLTADTVAAKLPLVAPAGSDSEPGTVTAGLLLASFTLKPPLGTAAFIDTVQLSVPAPVITGSAQLSPISFGTPLADNPTFFAAESAELLVNVS